MKVGREPAFLSTTLIRRAVADDGGGGGGGAGTDAAQALAAPSAGCPDWPPTCLLKGGSQGTLSTSLPHSTEGVEDSEELPMVDVNWCVTDENTNLLPIWKFQAT